MAAGDTPITIVGNLVNDPELRFTASGQPVATFRVASTPRIRDNSTGEWKDGDSLFLTCNVWRQMAENCAESLQRGMRVIVSGRLRQRNYETQQGEKRTVYEIEADDVGPSLLRASAKVTKATRAGGDGGFGGGHVRWGQPRWRVARRAAAPVAATTEAASAAATATPAAAPVAPIPTPGPPTTAAATQTNHRSNSNQ